MPGELFRIGIERRVAGQPNLSPVIICQRPLIGAVLAEIIVGDQDGEGVRDRPQAVIKQPMGVLAEGDAIPDVVIPGISELVDMRGVDDAARGDCHDPVASQRTSIVVSGDNLETETGLPTFLARFFGRLVGGRVDDLMMRIVDVLYSLPYVIIVIVLLALLPAKTPTGQLAELFFALGAVSWLTMARIVRGQVMSLKHQDFILAARATGVSTPKIIFRHLVPNALGPVIVYATLTIPTVMLSEAFLSFLGLGVRPPRVSWGSLAADGVQTLAIFPWQMIFPGLTMALMLLSLNFLGDGLRDALDPQMRRE